jgi:uncharacterized membrane protein
MIERLPVLFRSAMYALRGGFLIRPLVIAVILGIAGAVFSSLEEAHPEISAWIPSVLFPSRQDPGVAQVILSSIATSIMTVVSIVFAILLMTLTLASTQFSPRILIGFARDRTTQWTLGVFLGTFSYCIATLPAARALPHPFVPVASVTGAMLLALVCVGWLIYFINHISQSISVNHIVDRLARETELVIDELMPYPRGAFPLQQRSEASLAADEAAVLSAQSGYIRFINISQLVAIAKAWGIRNAPSISSPPSISVRRVPCSRMSSSASSKSPISACARSLPPSTIPARRSAAWISSTVSSFTGPIARRRHRTTTLRRTCCGWWYLG